MNSKHIILTSLLTAGCLMASAGERVKEVEVFAPHWYGGVQVGVQHTVGELAFGDLCSFINAQLSFGYQFTSIWGARLSVNGFQSKGGTPSNKLDQNQYSWSWNYIAPTLDVTFSLTNALLDYNPDRKFDLGVFAGIGVNGAFGNEAASDANTAMIQGAYYAANQYDPTCPLRYLWDGSQVLPVGQIGVTLDYNITRNLGIGFEASGNVLSDKYNSKKAGNPDWYVNCLVGAKYRFGKTTATKRVTEPIETEIRYEEKIIHDTIYINVPVEDKQPEGIRRDIFYGLRNTTISDQEAHKIQELVSYLQAHPSAKLSVVGYADRGTGNPTINKGYAEKRAQTVADILAEKYGIDRSRMIVSSKGDTDQPFSENDLNRVSICIAE